MQPLNSKENISLLQDPTDDLEGFWKRKRKQGPKSAFLTGKQVTARRYDNNLTEKIHWTHNIEKLCVHEASRQHAEHHATGTDGMIRSDPDPPDTT